MLKIIFLLFFVLFYDYSIIFNLNFQGDALAPEEGDLHLYLFSYFLSRK